METLTRRLLLLSFALSSLLLFVPAADAAVIFLKARLDGAQEGGVTTNGDGAAFITYDDASHLLSWTVKYRNLTSPTNAAHFHGPALPGQTASPVVPIDHTMNPIVGSATITLGQASELLSGRWYVNIHTNTFPGGEIRGQVLHIDTNEYTVNMDGAQAGTAGSPNATSGTGSGTVTFNPATLQMTWDLTFSGLTSPVFAAHFHGPAQPFEQAGIVVPTDFNPPVTGSTTLTAAQAAELVNEFWYFNVHTNNFGNGEIRGQVRALNTSTAAPHLANISTRLQVLTGNNVAIAGFIIGGSADKTVAVTAIGPSLQAAGITNPLANPVMQIVRSSDGQTIATNDDWQSNANAAELTFRGLAPANTLESAALFTLPPGAYTAVVTGAGGGTGVGLVAVYEVDHFEVPLSNISTRGIVLNGNSVMIAGFIIQGNGPQTVVVTGIGPSLASAGISNPLANPTLSLVRSSDGQVIAVNDDWQTAPNAQAIMDAGLAPGNAAESAIMMTLPPGAYTAVLSGANNTTGVGIVAVYRVP
jgi:CHRD domain-containing protein